MRKNLTARKYWVVMILILGLTLFACNKKVVKPEAAGTAAGAAETPKVELEIKGKTFSQTMELGNVPFDFDSYEISPAAREVLIKNGEWLQENPDKEILIAGHCDERGTVEYNLALGDKRAKAVRDYYYRLGIKYERMATISYGKEKPLDLGHDEEAWAKNRRTETLLKK
ncbi:MAG: peptidoglycan-associated lipoprotein Pal [bacterium]|nr:peptidoglycan-associated lipoprotein Pal [bacterium]MDD5354475.1 peptidoglycan-associated lipoprotein Pal [bacterium]MDD5757219.1 peptidoglycan-associated lipoprotein Pal [bacterium]